MMRDSVKNGYLKFENNIFEIKNLKTDFILIKDWNDNKDFDTVFYKNNIFKMDGNVNLALPRSKYTYINNQLQGKGTFQYNESSSLRSDITLNKISSQNTVSNYSYSKKAPFHIKNNGVQCIKANSNSSDKINLMDIRLNDLYYNNSLKNKPIEIYITTELLLKMEKK
ncbi:MAG: hypothetical protein IPN97_04595 [Saprospiraceae bacterium]|nr:hypothetical protein [Saprospiraceae bacterium]